jgi:hypothetical protein
MAKKMKKRKKWPWIVLAILGLLVALAASAGQCHHWQGLGQGPLLDPSVSRA